MTQGGGIKTFIPIIKEAIAKGKYYIDYHFLDSCVEKYYIPLLEKAGYKCIEKERSIRTYNINWEYVKNDYYRN